MAERAFRNAIALSLLLIGLALVFYSVGGVLSFAQDAASLSLQGDAAYDAAFRVTVLLIALLYFFIGLSLIRSRPRYPDVASAAQRPGPVRVMGPTALMAARVFGLILFMLGVVLLFDFTPYGRDATLSAVLILAGIFGVAGTVFYAKPDPNLAAVGAVMGIIAASMLLFAQLTVRIASGPSNTYGAWETTNLVVPPVLGPVAVILAGACGILYAYARAPRAAHVTFIGLGVAALVYGIGLCLVGLATVFDIPYYAFGQSTAGSTLELLAITAGTALLVAGGVACIVAALISFVRTARGIEGKSGPDRDVVATTTPGHPSTTGREVRTSEATPVDAVRDPETTRRPQRST